MPYHINNTPFPLCKNHVSFPPLRNRLFCASYHSKSGIILTDSHLLYHLLYFHQLKRIFSPFPPIKHFSTVVFDFHLQPLLFNPECIDEACMKMTTESVMRWQRWWTKWSTTWGDNDEWQIWDALVQILRYFGADLRCFGADLGFVSFEKKEE